MQTMLVAPPKRIPVWLRIGLWITKRVTGKDLVPPKLLAWYPKAAFSSGVLESLVAHHDGQLDERFLKLIRMQASFTASCPFCIDMNSQRFSAYHITQDELAAIQGLKPLAEIDSFSAREKLALEYTQLISSTPLHFPQNLRESLQKLFSERELVIIVTTAAQVNYWARLIQGLGAPPAGFMEPEDWKI